MTSANFQTLRIHDGDRFCSALVKTTGHKLIHSVVMDDTGLRVLSEPKENLRFTTVLMRKGAPYPVKKMATAMKTWGRLRGMTAEARRLIDEALA